MDESIKAAKMSNEKVVIQIIGKVRDHREAFTFHDDEKTDHGMIGKAFSYSIREFLNKGQIKMKG